MNQYSSVCSYGNTIWYRGYDTETRKRIQKKIKYTPTLFTRSKDETGYKLLTDLGVNLLPNKFDEIKEANDAIKLNRELPASQRKEYHGNRIWEYCYLQDSDEETKKIDTSLIRIANIDIETISDDPDAGFPKPSDTPAPVSAITVRTNKVYYVFGVKDYKPNSGDVNYIKCQSELHLLDTFLEFWKKYDPDIITGWNIEGFDIPYLVNRISKLLGEDRARELSPWRMVREITVKSKYGEVKSYKLVGIETLDYIPIYKKIPHANASQESYALDHIANVELGVQKLDYSEYGSLYNLYHQNYQIFVDYNIHDVDLVHQLEQKLKFINLIINTAYDASVNFSDFMSQIAMVDNIVYKYATGKKLVIPARKSEEKLTQFTGAAVAPTLIGKYKWIVTYDLTSLYPHIQMRDNISPETLREDLFEGKLDIEDIVKNGFPEHIKQKCKDNNCNIAANGQYFTRDFTGIFPEIQDRMFQDRKKMNAAITDLENELMKLENMLKILESQEQ